MRIIGTVTKNVFTFSASLAIQKNMSVYSLFTVSIIRYGRYAIGARINVKCYNIVLPLTASTAKSVLLCRSLLPSTADTLRIIFLVDKDSYIVINYDKTHYFSNPQIKTACILSFVIYSSFTDYRIVNKLVTCFSSSIYGFLYMRSKKEFSYYNVPLLVGFSLRTTAIRFYARIAISSMSRTFIHPMYTPGILPRRIVALPFTGFTKYVPVYTSASLSFYESSIVEINKIAVNGKRVFRNSTSSRKPKFSNTTMIFLDDNSSTRSRYISRLSRRRGYLFRRSRRILRKVVRNRYVFRRFSK